MLSTIDRGNEVCVQIVQRIELMGIKRSTLN